MPEFRVFQLACIKYSTTSIAPSELRARQCLALRLGFRGWGWLGVEVASQHCGLLFWAAVLSLRASPCIASLPESLTPVFEELPHARPHESAHGEHRTAWRQLLVPAMLVLWIRCSSPLHQVGRNATGPLEVIGAWGMYKMTQRARSRTFV